MGYPMKSGYRSGQSVSPQGPSEFSGLSVEQFLDALSEVGGKLPANSNPALKGARYISRLLRLHPYLRAAMTAYDLYDAYYQLARPMLGWTLRCGGMSGIATTKFGAIGASACGSVVNGTESNWGKVNPRDNNLFAHVPQALLVPSSGIWSHIEVGWWSHTAGISNAYGPAGMPFRVPDPVSDPARHPLFDPWNLPIKGPYPYQVPWPWEAIPYRPSPWSDPSPRGPARVPRQLPGPGRWTTVPGVNPRTNPRVRPGVDPRTQPGVDPVPEPSRPGDPVPPVPPVPPVVAAVRPASRVGWSEFVPVQMVRQSSAPRYRPPGRGVTEAKLGGSGARAVWLLAHVVTEGKDIIEAMWKALPKELRTRSYKHGNVAAGKFGQRGGPLTWDRAKDVLSGIKKLGVTDPRASKFWNDAVDNLIANQIEDYVHGKLGKAVGAQSRKAGRPIGYSSGPAL